VPGEDGVRADDGGDLAEDSAAEKLTLRRQPSYLVVGLAEAVPFIYSNDSLVPNRKGRYLEPFRFCFPARLGSQTHIKTKHLRTG
jgi:hypothetical protein